MSVRENFGSQTVAFDPATFVTTDAPDNVAVFRFKRSLAVALTQVVVSYVVTDDAYCGATARLVVFSGAPGDWSALAQAGIRSDIDAAFGLAAVQRDVLGIESPYMLDMSGDPLRSDPSADLYVLACFPYSAADDVFPAAVVSLSVAGRYAPADGESDVYPGHPARY